MFQIKNSMKYVKLHSGILPLQINFDDKLAFFVFNTNLKFLYKIDIKDFKK